ncbi:helix-turn-helix transcriptional regulator [Dactylosporangium sp. NPDC049525]|uniref:helix-turn-helix domain-containing protein n=1 Tax=Dactylosporangium sp. NPDC049525 TaxID=3154730 RepID=UPI0034161189
MIDPAAISQAKQALGRKLADCREAADLNQHQLAPLIQYTRSTIANAETGHSTTSRAFWQRCDEALSADGDLLRSYDELKTLARTQQAEHARALEAKRVAKFHQRHEQHHLPTGERDMTNVEPGGADAEPAEGLPASTSYATTTSVPPDAPLPRGPVDSRHQLVAVPTFGSSPEHPPALVEVPKVDGWLSNMAPPCSRLPDAVRTAALTAHPADSDGALSLAWLRRTAALAHGCYQRAEYDRTAELVPTLMAATSASVFRDDDQRHIYTAMATAHLAVSKLALKFGDAQLAWVAADRAHARAAEADAPALIAVALFSIGCALLAMPGRERDAADVVERGLASTTRSGSRTAAALSGAGALTLLAAVVAARHNDRPSVRSYLRAAGVLADRLGSDRNDLWTGFGPTNVLIHHIGITARYDPERSIVLGEQLDTSRLHPALVSRRSQVHLDLATAFTQRPGGDASAVLHLLQAEQLSPQLFRVHPPAQALIVHLLRHERRAATPGLRALAARARVAT